METDRAQIEEYGLKPGPIEHEILHNSGTERFCHQLCL